MTLDLSQLIGSPAGNLKKPSNETEPAPMPEYPREFTFVLPAVRKDGLSFIELVLYCTGSPTVICFGAVHLLNWPSMMPVAGWTTILRSFCSSYGIAFSSGCHLLKRPNERKDTACFRSDFSHPKEA